MLDSLATGKEEVLYAIANESETASLVFAVIHVAPS